MQVYLQRSVCKFNCGLKEIYVPGKSSHIPTIIASLEVRCIEVVLTREPAGAVLGERLHAFLLHDNRHYETETLLMFAARREHIANVIEPTLARGAYELSDCFTDAIFAYQCGAKGILSSKVDLLKVWVQGALQPDLTVLFDVLVEVSIKRLTYAHEPDKFEREGAIFFEKLRHANLVHAEENPSRFCLTLTKHYIKLKIWLKNVFQLYDY